MVGMLPRALYRADAVRELDRRAIEEHGIAGYELMCRAGEAAWRALRERWPRARNLLVLCGAGNNAGDGYVVARLAHADGWPVTVAALIAPERLRGDAALAWQAYRDGGGQTAAWSQALLEPADLLVDAVLGTGLDRPLEGLLAEAVRAVNASRRPVYALDIPSGLHADHGVVMGVAVRAQMTMTFVALKLGLYTGVAREHVGELRFDGLGIAPGTEAGLPVAARRIDSEALAPVLGARARLAHKGDFGHVLVVGGERGMAGAVALTGLAALRAGAGRVTVATRAQHAAALSAAHPELMCRGVETRRDLDEVLGRADVIALGPGLGTGDWGRELYAAVLHTERPLVIDADALNLLAEAPVHREDWILTPHPGEAARLLDASAGAVQRDRMAALGQLLARYGGTVVLKGAATLVGRAAAVPWLCDRGNPGMAAAGMGDVLTGVVAALAAQGATPELAAIAGVYAHAAAGDEAARAGERGLIARDVIAALRAQLNPAVQ